MVPKVILASLAIFLAMTVPLAIAQTEDAVSKNVKIITDKASYTKTQTMTVEFELYTYSDNPCVKYEIVYVSDPTRQISSAPPCMVEEKTEDSKMELKTIQKKIDLRSIEFTESGDYIIRVYNDGAISEKKFTVQLPAPPAPPSSSKTPSNDLAVFEGADPNEKGISELSVESQEKDQRIADLEAENLSLKDQIAELTKKIDKLAAIIQAQIDVIMSLIAPNTTA